MIFGGLYSTSDSAFPGSGIANAQTADTQDAEKWRNQQTAQAITGQIPLASLQGMTGPIMAGVLTQAQYDSWKNTFYPVIEQMLGQSTYANPQIANEQISEAISSVNSRFNSAEGMRNRYASQYGLDIDPATQAENSRISNVKRSAAVVDAANRIRQSLMERNKQIMEGGIPKFTPAI